MACRRVTIKLSPTKKQSKVTKQPSSYDAEVFCSALDPLLQVWTKLQELELLRGREAVDWSRTWAPDRTIMHRIHLLRITSKKIKEVLDKLRPPTVVKTPVSGSPFWNIVRNGTAAERRQHILKQLEKITSRCRITTLDLSFCSISSQDAERLARVLAHCPSLSELCLARNSIQDQGAGKLAGVLAQCPALSCMFLSNNLIGDEGAGRLAQVLPQCPALSLVVLGGNQIGDEGAGRLAQVLPKCPALSLLVLGGNRIGDEGAGRLAEVLPQCPALSVLDLGGNRIRAEGARTSAQRCGGHRLLGVLPQCPALTVLTVGIFGAGDPVADSLLLKIKEGLLKNRTLQQGGPV